MENRSMPFFVSLMNLLVLATTHQLATTGAWFKKLTDGSEKAYDIFNEYFHQCSLKEECKFVLQDFETKAFKLVFEEKNLPNDKQGSVVWKKMSMEYPAQWATGDGIGGSEEHLIGTFTNKEVCYMKCLPKKRNGKFANGVTFNAATGACYCEYGQNGRNGVHTWINTFIKRS